jgi:hypothetical protein
MICQWSEYGVRCHEAAEYILVYGCLNQHIAERLYCDPHCAEWASLFEAKQIPCFHLGCTLKSVQWDYLDVGKIRNLNGIKVT